MLCALKSTSCRKLQQHEECYSWNGTNHCSDKLEIMVFINIIIAQEVQSVSVGFCLRTTKQYTTAIVGDSRAIGYG